MKPINLQLSTGQYAIDLVNINTANRGDVMDFTFNFVELSRDEESCVILHTYTLSSSALSQLDIVRGLLREITLTGTDSTTVLLGSAKIMNAIKDLDGRRGLPMRPRMERDTTEPEERLPGTLNPFSDNLTKTTVLRYGHIEKDEETWIHFTAHTKIGFGDRLIRVFSITSFCGNVTKEVSFDRYSGLSAAENYTAFTWLATDPELKEMLSKLDLNNPRSPGRDRTTLSQDQLDMVKCVNAAVQHTSKTTKKK